MFHNLQGTFFFSIFFLSLFLWHLKEAKVIIIIILGWHK